MSTSRLLLGLVGAGAAIATVGVLLAATSAPASRGLAAIPHASELRCPTCRNFAWHGAMHRAVWKNGWHHPACPLVRPASPPPGFVETKGVGQTRATRPSCLECVDKHLGAAWVLIAETRDGYPHRLRAIGHLHEAEDESQEYPELHEAIRRARKRYQQEGVCPDFARLEAMVARRRG